MYECDTLPSALHCMPRARHPTTLSSCPVPSVSTPPPYPQLHSSSISPADSGRHRHAHSHPPFPSPRPPGPPPSPPLLPSVRESQEASAMAVSASEVVGQYDLLIVGPGVLGRIVAVRWQQEHPGCKIYGHTATTDHHSELTQLGIIPSLKGPAVQKVPYVIFCAPPYRTDDYTGDLRVAASNWNGEGSFLFTSSTAVYDCSDNGLCSEDSPCAPIGRSPRTDVLLKAENAVLEAGGSVLRLDAASLAIAIMKRRLRARVFVGCDNQPLSRQEIMDLVNRSGKFDTKFQGFTGTDGPLGKRMENSKTRAEIGWQPKYASFTEFLGLSN
uniref:NAD-dependent epimerase/dehydratase domain-containing protein n=1 Tax=Oryza punctata TaxID=4537 RepID=A0A0E0JIV5_ORYPU